MKKLMIIMLLISIYSAVKAGELELKAPEEKKASPRSAVTFGFAVNNGGREEVTVDFSVKTPELWELLRIPDTRAIAPGEEVMIPVTVLIPSQTLQGQYQISLVAQTEGERLLATGRVEVTSQSSARISFLERQLIIPKGSKVAVGFVLENTGNCPDNYWLRSRLGGGLVATPLNFKSNLQQGEIVEGIMMVEAPLTAELGGGWLEVEVGRMGEVRVLARERLPFTVVSKVASSCLSPELLGKLALELIWGEGDQLQLQGNFLGSSNLGRGYLTVDIERYSQEQLRSQVCWREGKWALSVGDIYLSGSSLQEPVDKRGLLFTLQEEGKNTNFFWHPGYFSYRKEASFLAVATDKEQKLWFYGRTETGQKVRIWGEVGLPVAGLITASSTGIRLGGQRKIPNSFWTVDWLQAGATTWGRNQDLWRLSIAGQNNPLLFSYYSQHNLLKSSAEERGSAGVNLPIDKGNIILRLGYGRSTNLEDEQKERGWEAILSKRWGNVHLYLAQSTMPLDPRRVQLRLGRYTGSFSTWLAASRQEDFHELVLGLLWRRGSRQWEFLLQGQEESQSLALNMNQSLARAQTLTLGAKVTTGEVTN